MISVDLIIFFGSFFLADGRRLDIVKIVAFVQTFGQITFRPIKFPGGVTNIS